MVGDRLQAIIERSVGAKLLMRKDSGCGCGDWVRKCNKWGIRGCRQHRENIVAHLVKQGQKQSRIPALGRLLSSTGVFERKAELWLDQAIQEESVEHPFISLLWTDTADSEAFWYSVQSTRHIINAGNLAAVGAVPEWFPGDQILASEEGEIGSLRAAVKSQHIEPLFLWMPPVVLKQPTTMEFLAIPRINSDQQFDRRIPMLLEKDKLTAVLDTISPDDDCDIRATYGEHWVLKPEQTAEYLIVEFLTL